MSSNAPIKVAQYSNPTRILSVKRVEFKIIQCSLYWNSQAVVHKQKSSKHDGLHQLRNHIQKEWRYIQPEEEL